MQIFKGIDSITDIGETTVTVGSFDGVHSGHRSLLRLLRQRATQSGSKSVVVSFSPHPRVALSRSEGLQLLTSDSEKAELLANDGIDALLLLEFNKAFSELSYEDFLIKYLHQGANMIELIAGFNHHLGHNSGSFNDLKAVAASKNFAITLAEEYSTQGVHISSTAIRQLLENGEIAAANKLLAHPYLMIGDSDSMGRVSFDEPLKLIPPAGHYIADINGEKQQITIDQTKTIWCDTKEKRVNIKILDRDEK